MSEQVVPEWDYEKVRPPRTTRPDPWISERRPRGKWAVISSYADAGAVITTTHGVYRWRWWANHQAASLRRFVEPDTAVFVRPWPTLGVIESNPPLTDEQVQQIAARWRAEHGEPPQPCQPTMDLLEG